VYHSRCHGDDDIALFVSRFNISVRLDHLLERVAALDHGLQPARITVMF
jgi:hypothetical protein